MKQPLERNKSVPPITIESDKPLSVVGQKESNPAIPSAPGHSLSRIAIHPPDVAPIQRVQSDTEKKEGYVTPPVQGERSSETVREEAPQPNRPNDLAAEDRAAALASAAFNQIAERLGDLLSYESYEAAPVNARLKTIKDMADLGKSTVTESSGTPKAKELRSLMEHISDRAGAMPNELQENPNRWEEIRQELNMLIGDMARLKFDIK